MVAVGNLDRVWLTVPDDVSAAELQKAFRYYFDAEWAEVLEVSDKSFAYNAFNNAYFSVRGLRPVENLTLDQLLAREVIDKPPNIIVS